LSYKLLVDEVNLTQEEVADRMHKERSTVTNYLRLLKLPPTIQQAVRENIISMGHAKCILGVPHIEQQLYAFNEIVNNKLSVRQSEALIQQLNKPASTKIATEKESLPPAYKRMQDELASKFSTKVVLQRNKKGAGTIVLEFYNDNDLNRILEAIGE
jgi:ParB family transcriptional regulator, chromosome partitioning protein